jgi:hypothetical protein
MVAMEPNPRRTRLFTILGGAAAAATAAFVASRLGVAGTIVGAAIASIVASVGAEVYGRAVHRSAEAMTVLALRTRNAAGVDPSSVVPDDGVADEAEAGPADEAAAAAEVVARADGADLRFSWKHVALVAGGVFVIVLAAITLTEIIIGKPISALWGGSSDSGTSIGGVVRPGGSTPAPTTPPPSAPPTTAPVAPTSPTVPTSDPTPTPTVTVTVTVPPTTPVPATTPGATP